MTEANTIRPLWALVNSSGKRLRNPYTNVLLPVFRFPIEAFDHAESLGINRSVYDIIDLNKNNLIMR